MRVKSEMIYNLVESAKTRSTVHALQERIAVGVGTHCIPDLHEDERLGLYRDSVGLQGGEGGHDLI